jgi:peptide/nickel transport system permease protein
VSSVEATSIDSPLGRRARLRGTTAWTVLARSRSAQVGAAILLFVVAVAFIGPFVRPDSPTAIVGAPFQGPSGEHWLGTDFLGRDALSRYLSGGRTLLAVAVCATLLAYAGGIAIGLIAGFRRGLTDLATVAAIDVFLAIPPIIVVLAALAALGPQLWLIVVATGLVFMPRVARLVRTMTLEITTEAFVEAAVARGERMTTILRRDLLPNILLPLSADMGIRLSGAVILVSSLSYLGLGQPPPTPDWGVMISENRAGLTIQPWVVLVPAATIALAAIGVNMLADAFARWAGQSVTSRDA